MQTVNIGKFGGDLDSGIPVNFDQVSARIIPGSKEQPRPQFCIELTGANISANIYAASLAAFDKLKKAIANENQVFDLVPGEDVLGIHVHRLPKGWPHEALGGVKERKAPAAIVANAAGSIPDPLNRYPFPNFAGIEVIRLDPNRLVKFMPYNAMEKIITEKSTVILTFAEKRSHEGVVVLVAVCAAYSTAASLMALIGRREPRRLMINRDVAGICLLFANREYAVLGDCKHAAGNIMEKIFAQARST